MGVPVMWARAREVGFMIVGGDVCFYDRKSVELKSDGSFRVAEYQLYSGMRRIGVEFGVSRSWVVGGRFPSRLIL